MTNPFSGLQKKAHSRAGACVTQAGSLKGYLGELKERSLKVVRGKQGGRMSNTRILSAVCAMQMENWKTDKKAFRSEMW